jgi:hydrogenase expression/formation protein HypC
MCVSLPGTVIEIDGIMALVQTAGVRRWCNALAHPELRPGSRVLVHAGLVVSTISDEEAREIEAAFAEIGMATSIVIGGE